MVEWYFDNYFMKKACIIIHLNITSNASQNFKNTFSPRVVVSRSLMQSKQAQLIKKEQKDRRYF